VPVSPATPSEVDSRVTLRPAPGYRPVLMLADKTPGEDVALFTLYHQQIHFENLEFYLRPDRTDLKSLAVAKLAGNGLCSFKDCGITLEAPEGSMTALNVVAL